VNVFQSDSQNSQEQQQTNRFFQLLEKQQLPGSY